MNDSTYHVGWVVCLLVCRGRLGVWSFLRWSSTGGIGVCILAVARLGIACVSLRHTSTDHSLPYFNSGLLQQHGPPTVHMPITGLKRLQCKEGILTLMLMYISRDAVDFQFHIVFVDYSATLFSRCRPTWRVLQM